MLLLIDTDRLTSPLRFEPVTAGGEAFPHVYGPVHLDAIFEATPYRPGSDRRFSPHERPAGSPLTARRPCPRPGGGRLS